MSIRKVMIYTSHELGLLWNYITFDSPDISIWKSLISSSWNCLLAKPSPSRLYLYSTLCKNCFLVTLSPSPSIPLSLANGLSVKRDVYIYIRPINVTCLQCVYMYILLSMYILCISTYIWMWELQFQDEEERRTENRWTMNIYEKKTEKVIKVINDLVFNMPQISTSWWNF